MRSNRKHNKKVKIKWRSESIRPFDGTASLNSLFVAANGPTYLRAKFFDRWFEISAKRTSFWRFFFVLFYFLPFFVSGPVSLWTTPSASRTINYIDLCPTRTKKNKWTNVKRNDRYESGQWIQICDDSIDVLI